MGPAPSLQAYQQAAVDIYNPQKQAEAASLATQKQNTINTLESGKGTINADYQTAIDNLNSTLKSNIGKINQLYTQRLGGNFSGLQGNDVGGIYAAGSKNQSAIEMSRANKLNDIAVQEANATNTYNTNAGNLESKYHSLEEQNANNAYGAAVKQHNTESYQQQSLALRQESIDAANARAGARASAGKAPTQGQIKQQDMSTVAQSLQNKAGKDGHVSQETWNASMAQWLAAGYSAKEFIDSNLQFVNQRYGGYHGYS